LGNLEKREDEEISIWEKEMDAIKTRINTVTTEIFDNAYN